MLVCSQEGLTICLFFMRQTALLVLEEGTEQTFCNFCHLWVYSVFMRMLNYLYFRPSAAFIIVTLAIVIQCDFFIGFSQRTWKWLAEWGQYKLLSLLEKTVNFSLGSVLVFLTYSYLLECCCAWIFFKKITCWSQVVSFSNIGIFLLEEN